MPPTSIIPVLAYDDVEKAIDWLCTVFGFTERWRAGNHRAQLNFGNGTIVVTAYSGIREPGTGQSHSLMVRVENVDSHYENARKHGALILHLPAEFPYGEKQYSVQDIGGHVWMFTESVKDVDVEDWGGSLPG